MQKLKIQRRIQSGLKLSEIKQFNLLIVFYNIRMIVIYFVCKYLFIPKKKLVEDTLIDDDNKLI